MATFNKSRESVLDQLLNFIISKEDPTAGGTTQNFNLTNRKRFVNQNSGQINIGSIPEEDTPVVIYQEDFQEKNMAVDSLTNDGVHEDLTAFLDNIVSGCLSTSIEEGGYIEITNTSFFSISLNDVANGGLYSRVTYGNTYTDSEGTEFVSGCNFGATLSYIDLTDNVLDILSQFLSFENNVTLIDKSKADEILDTRIYELLPQLFTRQERIDRLIREFDDLAGEKPSSPADQVAEHHFDTDVDADSVTDTWAYDLALYQDNWHNIYGIVPEVDPNLGNMIRLKRHETGENVGKSLESLRERIDEYLTDVDKAAGVSLLDDRTDMLESENSYLQIRHMNQAIIIRNEENEDYGIVGSNVDDPLWAKRGFTIGMWVRFLDRINSGTLFNFGNPTRENNPKGFMLQTFTLKKDDLQDEIDTGGIVPVDAFTKNDYERFVRLVVREPNGDLRDSHIGNSTNPRLDTVENNIDILSGDESGSIGGLQYAFNYTRIPIDFSDWYYIVATYDPFVDEELSLSETAGYYDVNSTNPLYWLGHINVPPDPEYTHYSGLGTKCKVEFISKSDLMRARGYKV